MVALVKISTRVTEVLLYPFKTLNPFWGILWLSVISSVIILFVYKWVSSPTLIRRAKDRIKADILAIRIYKDQWKVIIVSFFSALLNVVKYFLLNLMPLIVIFPLLFFLFVQMEWRYGVRPFNPGEETLVKVKTVGSDDVFLQPSNFYREKVRVRVPALNEVDFRIEITGKGKGVLKFKAESSEFSKEIVSSRKGEVLVPVRFSRPSLQMLLYPWEPLLEDPEIEWVKVKYPSTRVKFLGINAHWIIWYLVLVVLLVLPVHKKFGIEF